MLHISVLVFASTQLVLYWYGHLFCNLSSYFILVVVILFSFRRRQDRRSSCRSRLCFGGASLVDREVRRRLGGLSLATNRPTTTTTTSSLLSSNGNRNHNVVAAASSSVTFPDRSVDVDREVRERLGGIAPAVPTSSSSTSSATSRRRPLALHNNHNNSIVNNVRADRADSFSLRPCLSRNNVPQTRRTKVP